MPEFGCDKWRLDDINYEGAVFRCPKVDTNAGLGLYRSVTSFDTAERTKIAEEELDCGHCEFRTYTKKEKVARMAGEIIVDSCGYCPRSYREVDNAFGGNGTKFYCKELQMKIVGSGDDWESIDPDCPLPPVQTVVKRTITKRTTAKSCYEPRPLSDLKIPEKLEKRKPNVNPYNASGR